MTSILKLFGIMYLIKNHKTKLYSGILLFIVSLMSVFFTNDIVAILEKSNLQEYIVYPYIFKWSIISIFILYVIFSIKSLFQLKEDGLGSIKGNNQKDTIDINILKKDKLMSKGDSIINKKLKRNGK
jgi:hypothetical protein